MKVDRVGPAEIEKRQGHLGGIGSAKQFRYGEAYELYSIHFEFSFPVRLPIRFASLVPY